MNYPPKIYAMELAWTVHHRGPKLSY